MCAWNIFMQATLFHHPTLAYSLFVYQKAICNFVRRHKFSDIYMYDMGHRKQIASQRSTSPLGNHIGDLGPVAANWTAINDELYNIFLRDPGTRLPTCYHCKASGHFASTCPSKQQSSSFPRANHQQPPFRGAPRTSFSTQQPSTTTNTSSPQNTTCNRFNKTGHCFKPPCQFQHVCQLCGRSNHPAIQCFNPSPTATFRP